MKPTRLTLLLPILLLAGCGTGVGDVMGPTAGRRTTRQDVYQACNSIGGLIYPADEVDGLIWIAEQERDAGRSSASLLQAGIQGCEDAWSLYRDAKRSCLVCNAAIVEYVYN